MITPGSSNRIITLPSATDAGMGSWIIIVNTSTVAANLITLRHQTYNGTLIGTITPAAGHTGGQGAKLMSTGSAWVRLT